VQPDVVCHYPGAGESSIPALCKKRTLGLTSPSGAPQSGLRATQTGHILEAAPHPLASLQLLVSLLS
jgi:hypothetical protein